MYPQAQKFPAIAWPVVKADRAAEGSLVAGQLSASMVSLTFVFQLP
jgi:hypothetical protein